MKLTNCEEKLLLVLWLKEEVKKAPSISKHPVPSEPCIDLDDGPTPSKKNQSKYSGQMQRMDELEEIVEQLSRKHEKNFTPEQIRAWGHMIQMRKHESYENPPDKPFFRSKATSSKPITSDSLSPGRRISYRTQCIDQLDKWHLLMERGALSPEQYKDMQQSILADIQKF
jgi:hypothetical protein